MLIIIRLYLQMNEYVIEYELTDRKTKFIQAVYLIILNILTLIHYYHNFIALVIVI